MHFDDIDSGLGDEFGNKLFVNKENSNDPISGLAKSIRCEWLGHVYIYIFIKIFLNTHLRMDI